jgi:hypothetical protein
MPQSLSANLYQLLFRGEGAPENHSTPNHWPTCRQLLAARGATGVGEWVKTSWRLLRSRPHQALLTQALASHAPWAQRFECLPGYYHCAISHFIDRRLSAKARLQAMAHDLNQAAQLFGPHLSHRLAQGEWVKLWSLSDQVHLCLGANDVSYHEGLWSLALRNNEGRRLYYLSFAFVQHQGVLVPTIQGPACSDDDSREVIRQLTKQAEGMRPPALLMAALRSACSGWAIQRLAGIAPEHHIKGRWNLRKSRLRFAYATFWQEQGGQMGQDGHWHLPLTLASRSLQDTPSQKRAMYRRRQTMLASLDASIAQGLGQVPAQSERHAA